MSQIGSMQKLIEHPGVTANNDVLKALLFIKSEIARLSPRLRQKVEEHFVVVKEFVEDFDVS